MPKDASPIANATRGQAEATFLEWAPTVDIPPPRKAPPRLYHRKSRRGCAQCKARRVKCDEVHPTCRNCHRHAVECIYDRLKTAEASTASSHLVDRTRPASPSKTRASKNASPPPREIPESSARRHLELELLHRYMSSTSTTLTVFEEEGENHKDYWTVIWPRKAFENEALLNSILAVTAQHWSKLEPDNEDAAEAHRRYLGLAISQHRHDVAHITKENVDAACLTAVFMRLSIFSTVVTRDLEPYVPPFAWLRSTRGSFEVWTELWVNWIRDDETSITRRFVECTDVVMDEDVIFHADNSKGLEHLYSSNVDDNDAQLLEAPEVAEAYETTVRYIGGVRLAIANQKSEVEIFRRLVSFPLFIRKRYIDLVEESQPRALVILCYYLALLIRFRSFWWIDDTGEREIRAIEKVLQPRWLAEISWPLRVLDEPELLTPTKMRSSMQSPGDIAVEVG